MKPLKGLHHITAITSSAEKIYDFFTYILGLRLVKKTVNQDDIQTYHLFFADDRGQEGTDMTFFDFQGIGKAVKGANEISRSSFRVKNDEALAYWLKRFKKYDVKHSEIKELFGIKMIEFSDFDDQDYALFSDEKDQGVKGGTPWQKGPIPLEYAIYGLGPIFFRVNQLNLMDHILTDRLTFKKTDQVENFSRYQTGQGGNGATVIVEERQDLFQASQGYGGVHHVAFGVDDQADLEHWIKKLNLVRAPHSGLVDRFYFKSLYTRLYPGILFEFATSGPGFIDDEEPYETLGELLALPPKLRHLRKEIEAVVRNIDTKRSDKKIEKEYLS